MQFRKISVWIHLLFKRQQPQTVATKHPEVAENKQIFIPLCGTDGSIEMMTTVKLHVLLLREPTHIIEVQHGLMDRKGWWGSQILNMLFFVSNVMYCHSFLRSCLSP